MRVVTDHLGNTYLTFKEMCKCWDIDVGVVTQRLHRGATLEQALTAPLGKNIKKRCKDHLGNEYNSIGDMCKHYKIPYSKYYRQIKNEVPLADILEGVVSEPDRTPRTAEEINQLLHRDKRTKTVQDHLGNKYSSITKMAEAYGLSDSLLRQRLTRGFPLKDALQDKIYHTGEVEDHLGKIYKSTSKMCRAYNISVQTYLGRIARGWSQKRALTEPLVAPN